MSPSARRFLVAAFGDAGHAFPAIALAVALRERGHEVVVETWEHWRAAVEGAGLEFTAAQEYKTFPPPPADASEGPSAADAARALLPFVEEFRPDAVVSDILTVAPALAAEMAGCRRATLVPHVYPVHEPGLPFFAFGAQPPRTAVGTALWKAAEPVLVQGLKRGRREMNETRAALGLAPLEEFHGGLSTDLVLVATFPQLEYPRRWPEQTHVTGPMTFELEHPDVEVPEGDGPLVVVAPSTAQDPERKLLRWALEALADEPVRVLATTNQLDVPVPMPEAPANANGRRLALLLAGDAAGGLGDHARRARDRVPGAGRGRAAALLPCGRRHGRERSACAVGGRRADAAFATGGPASDPDRGAADAGGRQLRRSSV